MPQIKFSHHYKKLNDKDGNPVKTAQLLLVLMMSQDDLMSHTDFVKYDTDEVFTFSYSLFFVILVFKKPDGNLFTTVRPSHGRYGSKKDYYSKLIGQTFTITITQ